MKIKHNAGSKTEREKLAKSIVWAVNKGGCMADLQNIQTNINLPPGSIEKAAESLGVQYSQQNPRQPPLTTSVNECSHISSSSEC